MITESPFIVFSAERSELSDEANHDRTKLLGGALTSRGIEWQSVAGFYDGRPETSFLVFAQEGDASADQIERLARHYDQESILYVDAQRLAYLLVLKEGRTIELGKFKEIPKSELRATRAYTKVGERYYATAVV